MVYGNGRNHSAAGRDAKTEVLATHVRVAAEAATKALHATSADRKYIHEREWEETERDTLWDIDEVADSLHGFASWALSGRPHPERARVLKELRRLDHVLSSDLPSKTAGYKARCKNLPAYFAALSDLRQSLLEYFEAEDRLNRPPPARRPSGATRKPAAR